MSKINFNKIFKDFERKISKQDSKKNITDIIKTLANHHNVKEAELEKFLKYKLFMKVSKALDIQELTKLNIQKLKETRVAGFKLIESDLKKILEQSIYLAIRFGFKKSFSEKGLRTANEGDSAQFLFVARAILAGFNCSNVDLRSSKYDAVIDYHSTLLRVQVKGIALGTPISFVTRSRGGQGINYKHERNKGVRITKKDCDLYVAVNKETGACYIIPMEWIDNQKQNTMSQNHSKIKDFEENWDIIEKTAIKLNKK